MRALPLHTAPDLLLYFSLSLPMVHEPPLLQVFGFDPTIRPNSIPGLFGPDSPEYQTRFSFMQVSGQRQTLESGSVSIKSAARHAPWLSPLSRCITETVRCIDGNNQSCNYQCN